MLTLVDQIIKHIFISPLSALSGSKSQSTRAHNAKIHKMVEVDAYHIAYAAVHVSGFLLGDHLYISFTGLIQHLLTRQVRGDRRTFQIS
jgi:hypothetical protein